VGGGGAELFAGVASAAQSAFACNPSVAIIFSLSLLSCQLLDELSSAVGGMG